MRLFPKALVVALGGKVASRLREWRVPAGIIFDGQVDDLRRIVVGSDRVDETVDPVVEVCFIGLVAYFEAFCKGHFASLINICPQLIRNLEARNREVHLRAVDLLELDEPVLSRIGFLVAERYDFGTPKAVNALFTDLVRRTPFSSDEAQRFEAILDDRHLLVHHGGIFTPRYPTQRFVHRDKDRSRLYLDSLHVRRPAFLVAAEFLEGMSDKIRNVTADAAREWCGHGSMLSPSAARALENINGKQPPAPDPAG